VPLVDNPNAFAAGRYKPLPVTDEPVGINLVADAVPVVEKLVPSNVSADPEVRDLLPFKYVTPFAVPADSTGLAVRVATPVIAAVPDTLNVGIVTVPVNVGDAVSDFELTAVAMLSNSVFISVPLTIFKGSPEVRVSFVAKLVDFVYAVIFYSL
jgi:hypothetical protein